MFTASKVDNTTLRVRNDLRSGMNGRVVLQKSFYRVSDPLDGWLVANTKENKENSGYSATPFFAAIGWSVLFVDYRFFLGGRLIARRLIHQTVVVRHPLTMRKVKALPGCKETRRAALSYLKPTPTTVSFSRCATCSSSYLRGDFTRQCNRR